MLYQHERPRGGAKGIRTPDLFHAMEARYQLRHSPVSRRKLPDAATRCKWDASSQDLDLGGLGPAGWGIVGDHPAVLVTHPHHGIARIPQDGKGGVLGIRVHQGLDHIRQQQSMGDDQHLLPTVLGSYLQHRRQSPGGHLRHGLPRGRAAKIDALDVVIEIVRHLSYHLSTGLAAPRTNIDFMQPRLRDRLDIVGSAHQLRGLEGSLHRRGIAGCEWPRREITGSLQGLFFPHLIQRDVGLPLKSALDIPFGTAVPEEDQPSGGHCS